MKTVWRLIVIVVLVIGAIIFSARQGRDYSGLSKQVDMIVDGVFVASGINDENVTRRLCLEKNSHRSRWLEFIREVDTGKPAGELFGKLKTALQEYPVDVESVSDGSGIEIYTKGLLINRITFPLPRISRYRAAVVIDDIGSSISSLDAFLKLGIPLTYSIMPFEKHSKAIANELAAKRETYFLHQPMEPEKYPVIDPGKRALLLGMSDGAIRKITVQDIDELPGITGINNHMGSAFTKDAGRVVVFLKCVRERNLIFLDSWTSQKSVAYRTARAMGIPALRNDIFLDNTDDLDYITGQLRAFKRLILANGSGVAIGHIHKKNLPAALEKIIPEFRSANIEFVTVPEYLGFSGSKAATDSHRNKK
jgi:polysaccharide deacetylase 2 family uncharacterized protein YibQ